VAAPGLAGPVDGASPWQPTDGQMRGMEFCLLGTLEGPDFGLEPNEVRSNSRFQLNWSGSAGSIVGSPQGCDKSAAASSRSAQDVLARLAAEPLNLARRVREPCSLGLIPGSGCANDTRVKWSKR